MIIPSLIEAKDTLDIIQFQKMVLLNHPLIKSANIYDRISESYLSIGKGVLDPILNSDYDMKKFKSTNYFKRWNNEVKIPTKYPIDFSLGYENNNGDFINNDNVLPSNGIIYGTINISILRGLLFDEQRYSLNKSKLLANKSEIEKEIIIRNTFIQSLRAYLDWSTAYYELKLLNEYLERVFERHNFIKQLSMNGDKPVIDTIESRMNLNTAVKDNILAKEKLLMKRQKLNMFLWSQTNEPLILLDSVQPQHPSLLAEFFNQETKPNNPIWESDPRIKKKVNLINVISLENRIDKEQLKPQLDLKINTIHSLGETDLSYNYSINDYKFGATLEVPFRNRKTKGKIKLNEAMIDQTTLEKEYYSYELENNYIALLGSKVLNEESIKVISEKVINSNLLYEAEKLKFELGESSVFLLNTRERKLLEAEKDYIDCLNYLSQVNIELLYIYLGQNEEN